MSTLRQYEFKCLGYKGSFNGPAEVEVIERITGKPGICQEMFMQDYAYGDRNKQMREAVAAEVEKQTGVARLTKSVTKGDKTTTVPDESEQDYINRLQTTKVDPSDEKSSMILDDATFAQIWIAANEEIGDWSPGSSTTRKPAKPFYDAADDILAKIAAGWTNPADGSVASVERTTQKIEALLGIDFAATYGEFNRDNLARARRDIKERQDRDANNAIM